MEYDIEILVPVCKKYLERVEDFKRYGLLNTANRRVLVSLATSKEEIEGLEVGWPEGVDARVIKNKSRDHIANLYSFYADLTPDSIRAKWLMRMDDDTSTDIDGVLHNLESFYDWEDKFYLGELNDFMWALRTGENLPYDEYKHHLGEYERIANYLNNEVECSIMSKGGLLHMLKNERCMDFLRIRAGLEGGHGDCAVALAAALAKFYPTPCPFVSKDPLLEEFSIFDKNKIKNHVHLISRVELGDNFDQRSKNNFLIISKFVDKNPTEKEKTVSGKKFLAEADDFIKLYYFYDNYSLKIKFEDHIFHWMEDEEGKICIIDRGFVVNRFVLQEDGRLVGDNLVLTQI